MNGGTEAAGFAEPDGPHPIANLKPLPAGVDVTKAYAEAAAAGLSVDAGVTRWTCTRIQMIDALANIEAHPVLISGRAKVIAEDMADAILSQLPEASLDARDAEMADLKATIHGYENALSWHTSCLSCSRILDAAASERERAEKAEAELAAALARLRELTGIDGGEGWPFEASDGPPPVLPDALVPRLKRERDEARAERDAARSQLAILTKGDR